MEIEVDLGVVYLGNKKVCVQVNDDVIVLNGYRQKNRPVNRNGNKNFHQRKLQLTCCSGFGIQKIQKPNGEEFELLSASVIGPQKKLGSHPLGKIREIFY